MRNLLKGRFAYGVPQAQSLVGECSANSAGDARDRGHQRRAGGIVESAHVVEMLARDHQRVAGMKLPKTDEGHRQLVLVNHAGRLGAFDDLAKNAFVVNGSSPEVA